MNDHDMLLAAIRDNPDEDTPRLAFADWLQERGRDEYAEFLRTAVAARNRLKKRPRLSPEEGRWLSTNWAKMFPSIRAAGGFLSRRYGRWLYLASGQYYGGVGLRRDWCVVEVWQGFVRSVLFRRSGCVERFGGALLADQPLCVNFEQEDAIYTPYRDPLTSTFAQISRDNIGAAWKHLAGHDETINYSQTTIPASAVWREIAGAPDPSPYHRARGCLSRAIEARCRELLVAMRGAAA